MKVYLANSARVFVDAGSRTAGRKHLPVIKKLYQCFTRAESKIIGVFSAFLGMAGSLEKWSAKYLVGERL